MRFIIDGNNLAGGFKILDEPNFDLEVIERIKEYSNKKNRKILLIFDSLDPMGDKYEEEKLTIIYTPRDNFYKGADDKIIEELELFLSVSKEEFCVVTSDVELIDRVDKVAEEYKVNIDIYKTSDFIFELGKKEDDFVDEDRLDLEVENEISEEFLDLWT